MVFQNYALWPHMNVRENLAFGLRMNRVSAAERRSRVDEALALVRMREYDSRFPHELSGGQQQRVSLARALVLRPKLVLLDEPLSNLDARLRNEIRDEIVALHRNLGLTMIYVTHDQDEALSMAQNAALMRAGKIIQSGSPKSMYEHPINRYAAAFFGAANFFKGTLRKESGASRLCVTPELTLPLAGPVANKSATGEVLIRPEAFTLQPPGKPFEEPVWSDSGTVREILYFGADQRVTLELKGGQKLLISTSGRAAGVSIGERLAFSCPASDIVVLQD